MRLNRFLAASGLGSRRACEELVEQRRVLINGKEVKELATVVRPEDVVIVDGRKIKPVGEITLIMNKPAGVLTSREDETGMNRDTVYYLLPPNLHSLHYVGRLDYESEGLLILTSSGELTEKLTHPRYGIEKEYLVKLHKPFNYEEDGPKMLDGFDIEGGFAKAAALELVSPRVISLVLTQGIKRQIRYMLETLGYHVRRLQRVRIGSFVMPELKSGRWRILTADEVSQLLDNNTQRFRLAEKDKKKPAAQKPVRKAPTKKRPSSRQQKPFVAAHNARNDNYDQRRSSPSRSQRSAIPKKSAQRTHRPERSRLAKSLRDDFSNKRAYSDRSPRTSTDQYPREARNPLTNNNFSSQRKNKTTRPQPAGRRSFSTATHSFPDQKRRRSRD